MTRLSHPVLSSRLEPLLEALMSVLILLGFVLSAAALVGAMRHEVLPALLLVGYLAVPLPGALLAHHLLNLE